MHVLLTVLSIFHFITVNDIGLLRVCILECDADIRSGDGDWTELVGGGTSLCV